MTDSNKIALAVVVAGLLIGSALTVRRGDAPASRSVERFAVVSLGQTAALRIDQTTGRSWFSIMGGDWREMSEPNTNILRFADETNGWEALPSASTNHRPDVFDTLQPDRASAPR